MKIAFHDNSLSLRGTTVALYDYAYYNKHILGNESIILFDNRHKANDISVIEKFKKEFEVYSYNDNSKIDYILEKNNSDSILWIKGGQKDGKLSKVCPNWINAIAVCNLNDVHGDIYAMGSEWLSKITDYKIPFVPYMINIPDIDSDLRNELYLSKDNIIIGRNGGWDTFDLGFVKDAIKNILEKRKDIYFLFQNTEPFYNHKNIIYLNGNCDMYYKVKFINTCDVMLHARNIGESFGLSCGEFSTRNKPVITWNGSKERNHIDILGDKGIYYNDYNDIYDILLNINKFDSDYNCYKEYTPIKVMEKFKQIYL